MTVLDRRHWLACAVLVGAGCSPAAKPAHDTKADETAIRAEDAAWAKSASTKNAADFVSYYTDDAVVMAPGAPIVKGKTAITEVFTGMVKDPVFALTFSPMSIDVSGDEATEIGDYSITTTDEKSGKPASATGKYVVVWRRQADGSWKAAVDAPTTTQ
jgi:uncharacterized protein (TIGR02246 family)